jgi:Tfp pilus assembly protein PilE
MNNEIEFKVKLDSVMIILVAAIAALLLLFTSPSYNNSVAGMSDRQKPAMTQSEECFGPLQKFVNEEELVCR